MFLSNIIRIFHARFVTALTSRLNLGISIDNGVMHMRFANIPMIVLLDQQTEKFAPKIDSIKN